MSAVPSSLQYGKTASICVHGLTEGCLFRICCAASGTVGLFAVSVVRTLPVLIFNLVFFLPSSYIKSYTKWFRHFLKHERSWVWCSNPFSVLYMQLLHFLQ